MSKNGEPVSRKLDAVELDTLARYNAERYRGLVHTAGMVKRMVALQARFDDSRSASSGLSQEEGK